MLMSFQNRNYENDFEESPKFDVTLMLTGGLVGYIGETDLTNIMTDGDNS